MFTCRRCFCKNCNCDGCNCNNKRELIVMRKYPILWVIGGSKRKELSNKLCEKYKFDLLSVEDLLETEKNEENLNYGDQIKSLEENRKPIDENIVADLITQSVKSKQRDDLVGYLIESFPDLQQLIAFERAVGSINIIFNIALSIEELKTEFEEQVKKEISLKRKNFHENKGDADAEKKSKCYCIKKGPTLDEMTARKLKKFNQNVENIKSSCYKPIFKHIKGGDDLEKMFNNITCVIDQFFKKRETKLRTD